MLVKAHGAPAERGDRREVVLVQDMPGHIEFIFVAPRAVGLREIFQKEGRHNLHVLPVQLGKFAVPRLKPEFGKAGFQIISPARGKLLPQRGREGDSPLFVFPRDAEAVEGSTAVPARP